MATRLRIHPFSLCASRACHSLNRIPRITQRQSTIFARPSRRYYSQNLKNSFPDEPPSESHSIYARLKKLTREYGYTVMGVYVALSIVDFPLCFLAVKLLGEKRVAHAEHVVVGGVKSIFSKILPQASESEVQEESVKNDNEFDENSTDLTEADATIWTQLALAFVIHKSFMFIRVPLTAAVTPKVVKTLRGWGYHIGKRRSK
ncbi:hypothetical protein DM02DRAFT_716238 [Periconia macrospinosa]|uniref:DUF1279 domain-containing protein n=1 Tax=Periconia macrospinosa TaxID=97972 RepID=A0A2V1E589_9PLEO|nr:hypothetical protein DM02DRAFT_716238 [Periconia macrospinosa]